MNIFQYRFQVTEVVSPQVDPFPFHTGDTRPKKSHFAAHPGPCSVRTPLCARSTKYTAVCRGPNSAECAPPSALIRAMLIPVHADSEPDATMRHMPTTTFGFMTAPSSSQQVDARFRRQSRYHHLTGTDTVKNDSFGEFTSSRSAKIRLPASSDCDCNQSSFRRNR